jgi:two-component system sensor histidine kinase DctS
VLTGNTVTRAKCWSNREKFATLAPQLVSNNPELQEIIWRDADGKSVAAVPPASILDSANKALDLAVADAAAKSALTGQGALSNPIALHDNAVVLIYSVPIFIQGKNAGTLATVFSLDTILSHQIPWWIAEKSAVQI